MNSLFIVLVKLAYCFSNRPLVDITKYRSHMVGNSELLGKLFVFQYVSIFSSLGNLSEAKQIGEDPVKSVKDTSLLSLSYPSCGWILRIYANTGCSHLFWNIASIAGWKFGNLASNYLNVCDKVHDDHMRIRFMENVSGAQSTPCRQTFTILHCVHCDANAIARDMFNLGVAFG